MRARVFRRLDILLAGGSLLRFGETCRPVTAHLPADKQSQSLKLSWTELPFLTDLPSS